MEPMHNFEVQWCEQCEVRRSVCHVGHRDMTVHFCDQCEAEYRMEQSEWLDDMRRDR